MYHDLPRSTRFWLFLARREVLPRGLSTAEHTPRTEEERLGEALESLERAGRIGPRLEAGNVSADPPARTTLAYLAQGAPDYRARSQLIRSRLGSVTPETPHQEPEVNSEKRPEKGGKNR